MIIVIVEHLSNGDIAKRFGGVGCDVEDCDVVEPQPADARKDLVASGWFIAPGQHRCPKHFNDDVPGRGTVHHEIDKTTKVI